MYDSLFASIPKLSMASVGSALPRPDQLGFGQPLYAYVCNADHGRVRTEP